MSRKDEAIKRLQEDDEFIVVTKGKDGLHIINHASALTYVSFIVTLTQKLEPLYLNELKTIQETKSDVD